MESFNFIGAAKFRDIAKLVRKGLVFQAICISYLFGLLVSKEFGYYLDLKVWGVAVGAIFFSVLFAPVLYAVFSEMYKRDCRKFSEIISGEIDEEKIVVKYATHFITYEWGYFSKYKIVNNVVFLYRNKDLVLPLAMYNLISQEQYYYLIERIKNKVNC